MREWHRYTAEFKKNAVERLKGCTNVEALARELKVSRGILYLWRDKAEGRDRPKRPGPVVDTPAIAALKKEVADLKLALGEKAVEADFFRGALQRIEDRHRKAENNGDPASTTTSRKRRPTPRCSAKQTSSNHAEAQVSIS